MIPSSISRWIVARTREAALKMASDKLGKGTEHIELEQDEDVLDTWFSSGLFLSLYLAGLIIRRISRLFILPLWRPA